jgi:hypothetical protein
VDRSVFPLKISLCPAPALSPPAPRGSGMKLILGCIQILPLESVGLVITCCLLYFAWLSDSTDYYATGTCCGMDRWGFKLHAFRPI